MFETLKNDACQACQTLLNHRMVLLNVGSLSILDRSSQTLAIRPAHHGFPELQPEQMALTGLDGLPRDGSPAPAPSVLTHLRLYEAFPEINAIAHTHSKYATIFAQAGKSIKCLGATHAHFFYGDIPITRSMSRQQTENYASELGNLIVERYRDQKPLETPGILIHGHGAYTWGRTAAEAVQNALALEWTAELAFHTLQLNPDIFPIGLHLLDKHFQQAQSLIERED
jgi:L-ribulose-5-phosphate 4-epimerase